SATRTRRPECPTAGSQRQETDMIAPIQLVRHRASRAPQPQAKPVQMPRFGKEHCEAPAKKYHPPHAVVRAAVDDYSPERFLRLFLTAHGMPPAGTWQTHTYARIADSTTGRDHFFLIPIPFELHERASAGVRALPRPRPRIRFEDSLL